MNYLKLRSKQVVEQKFQQKTKIFNIRVINTPLNYDLYYYPKQNLLVRYYYQEFYFYSIHDNMIQKNDIKIKTQKDGTDNDTAIFLENFIMINRVDHVIKYNIQNLSEYQILKCRLTPAILNSTQINSKSFITLSWLQNRVRIYQIRNITKFYTILTKSRIMSTKYNHQIVQAITNKQQIYYFNTKMTKQVRKFCGYKEYEPIFNSNYIFVPFYEKITQKKKLVNINIYDISNMKVKGVIQTKNRYNLIFDSGLFIKQHNIIAIMYSKKLDLFDFSTLKCLGSEKFDIGYEQSMQYDQENGLTIFLKRNYRIRE